MRLVYYAKAVLNAKMNSLTDWGQVPWPCSSISSPYAADKSDDSARDTPVEVPCLLLSIVGHTVILYTYCLMLLGSARFSVEYLCIISRE